MFLHRCTCEQVSATGERSPMPLRQIDNFCMRNFTNDAIFDDTLPLADGLLEVGSLVPLDQLHTAMEQWFRRKGYLAPTDRLSLKLQEPSPGREGSHHPEVDNSPSASAPHATGSTER